MNKYKNFGKDLKKLCLQEKQKMIILSNSVENVEMSYLEIWDLIRRYGYFFNEKGIKSGDTIATILPNSVEAIVCFFAAAYYGINYAPLPCSVSQREYENWNALTRPVLYVIKKDIIEFNFTFSHVEIDTDARFSWLPNDFYNDDYRKSQAKIFLMTSGTTGTPKAMQIDVNKLWSAGYDFASEYRIIDSHLRFWNYLPMSYLGGLFNLAIIPLCCRGSFVISEPFSGKTMLNFWNFVKKYEITALWFVPSIVRGLLKLYSLVGYKYEELYKKIKISFLGTAPIDLATKEKFEASFGIRLYENFALSETTFLTAEKEECIRFREQSSVGEILPYVQLKMLPIDELKNIFEIWVKTPYLFDGYLDEEGKLIKDLDEEGYFNSKDLGFYNEDGQLVLSGRSRDIIKRGGLFVSLIEIENAVTSLDYVEEVAAVPIEHDFYGEAYILFVVFKVNVSDEKEKIEEVRKWMMDSFVPYKLPENIVALDEFPRTTSGKIIKKELATMFRR